MQPFTAFQSKGMGLIFFINPMVSWFAPFQDISISETSGWRPIDALRQDEIRTELMNGLVNHNIYRDPQLLKNCADDKPMLDIKVRVGGL